MVVSVMYRLVNVQPAVLEVSLTLRYFCITAITTTIIIIKLRIIASLRCVDVTWLQVRFVTPEDGTIQYPGRGEVIFDDDHDWRSRVLLNARDRHPKSFGSGGRRSSPPPRRKTVKSPPPSLTSPRVMALQATDIDTQQNPLYGATMDFIY